MALREILTEPNKLLRDKSLAVEGVDEDLQKLMNDMLETM
jgi:peptide deformylase